MRLKRELKHWWYSLAALALLTISCVAYTVVLWCLPLILLLLTFAKVEAALGGFTASTLMVVTCVIMMWVLKHKHEFILMLYVRIIHLLNAPARYGSHLLDCIDQEDP